MNAKEAREIYYGFEWSQKRCGSCEPNYCQHPKAKGYLEALHGEEVKKLVALLKQAMVGDQTPKWFAESALTIDSFREAVGEVKT